MKIKTQKHPLTFQKYKNNQYLGICSLMTMELLLTLICGFGPEEINGNEEEKGKRKKKKVKRRKILTEGGDGTGWRTEITWDTRGPEE